MASMVYSFSKLEEILDPRTTCLLSLCMGKSTMGCLHDIYTWVKKGKQSCVSRHNQVLGNGASDLFVPCCVYRMYMSRWTFAFPFCDLQQISRLVSVEGKEIAKNCCYTITVDTRREGLQMRGSVGFCTSRSWSVCVGGMPNQTASCLIRRLRGSWLQEWTPVNAREASLPSPSCYTEGPSASKAMVHWTDQNFNTRETLVPEQNLGLEDSKVWRQISPLLLAYKLSLSIWLTKNKDTILWEDMQSISHLQRRV